MCPKKKWSELNFKSEDCNKNLVFKVTAKEKGARISQPPEDEAWKDGVALEVRGRARDEFNMLKLFSTGLFKCSSSVKSEFTQLCLTLCDPMDCSLPGSSISGIFQARILKLVAISSSRGSSRARDRNCVSCIGRGILYHWAFREALRMSITQPIITRPWLHSLAPKDCFLQFFEGSLKIKRCPLRDLAVRQHQWTPLSPGSLSFRS